MQLQVRRNQKIGIMVHDEIVFQNNDAEPIVVGTGARGNFDETPYTPIKRYWSYKADLYQVQHKLIIQLVNITKIVDIVDGEWNETYSYEVQSLLSMDGGFGWSVSNSIEIESQQPISSVASQ